MEALSALTIGNNVLRARVRGSQERLVAAIATAQAGCTPGTRGWRLRAFVLLLRFSGMRISNVVNLSAERFVGKRLFLYTKTGVPVRIVISEFVLRVLESTPLKSENHFFWRGVGKLESIVRSRQKRLRRIFQLAGVVKGHAHRFRDTFAVDLLLADSD